mgnify:CR=1 FL=1
MFIVTVSEEKEGEYITEQYGLNGDPDTTETLGTYHLRGERRTVYEQTFANLEVDKLATFLNALPQKRSHRKLVSGIGR